jgi:hypothetical protein
MAEPVGRCAEAGHEAVRQLERTWEFTDSAWHDDARQRFESKHLRPILDEASRWVSALDQCAAELSRVTATLAGK